MLKGYFNNNTILVGLSNWQLETSPAERIAVERVMKEQPLEELGEDGGDNLFAIETKAVGHSLTSMKDRVVGVSGSPCCCGPGSS